MEPLNTKKGKLIVFEGACDGIGKTTQFKLLREHLEKDGHIVFHHHFPSYGTYHGAPVEKYLQGEFGQPSELSPYFINSLYAIDRGIAYFTKLQSLYEDGKIILLDRYTTSSLIYQSALIEDLDERKRFIDYVMDFEYNKIGIKEPDNVIFLEAPFDLVTSLRSKRQGNEGIANDIYEQDLSLMHKIYDNAMFIADYLAWDRIKCDNGEEMRPPESIHNDVYQLLKKKN